MTSLEASGVKPRVWEFLRRCAELHGVKTLVLYGSRARGDHRERSDIDLAFQGGDGPRFALDVDEDAPTLLAIDLVDLDHVRPGPFLESIRRDGVTVYDAEQAGQLRAHAGEPGDGPGL